MSRLTVICVDDEYILLESLKMELRSGLETGVAIETAGSGDSALALIRDLIASGDRPAVLITDQMMTGMNGDELIAKVYSISPETYCVLLTGYTDLEAVKNAINNGSLYRYINKPWDGDDLIITVKTALNQFEQRELISKLNSEIETLTYAMVTALENTNMIYDNDTGHHILRVGEHSANLARLAGADEPFIRRIELFAPLHDIGKIGIDPSILKKTGLYTNEEREAMKNHVLIGANMLDVPGIDPMARNIILHHHEKWDGSGYSNNLKGSDIPLEARIVSIIDVFDALTSRRCYKPSFSFEESIRLMKEDSGKAFDPELLTIFLDNIDQIWTRKENYNPS